MTARPPVARIPFRDHTLIALAHDGALHIVLELVYDRIGLDHITQIATLRTKPWAEVRDHRIQLPGDPRPLRYTTCDARTFLMALALVDSRAVPADVAPLLVAYQTEAADAIETYWTHTRDQPHPGLALGTAQRQAELLRTLTGLVDPTWLETQARSVADRALGDPPGRHPSRAPLTVA